MLYDIGFLYWQPEGLKLHIKIAPATTGAWASPKEVRTMSKLLLLAAIAAAASVIANLVLVQWLVELLTK